VCVEPPNSRTRSCLAACSSWLTAVGGTLTWVNSWYYNIFYLEVEWPGVGGAAQLQDAQLFGSLQQLAHSCGRHVGVGVQAQHCSKFNPSQPVHFSGISLKGYWCRFGLCRIRKKESDLWKKTQKSPRLFWRNLRQLYIFFRHFPVIKFYGWKQGDQWATQTDEFELTVSREMS
jgi:hypothetical protein